MLLKTQQTSGEAAMQTMTETPMHDMRMEPGDYARMERAIRYLDEHAREQPGLEDVASAVGLSPFHFQRLFSRWAGVSPKRFLQVLTLNHAKRALDESGNLLDAALDAGLSGPSRLHDLFVTVESVTPGEWKREGAGVRIAYGFHDTPFGTALAAVTARGLCGLAFIEPGEERAALDELEARWPAAQLEEEGAATRSIVQQAFGTVPRGPHAQKMEPLRLLLKGTTFQVQVWLALLTLPPGAFTSYGSLAQRVGHPRAQRAVGGAVGDNPVAFLIPCHRVIRSTGALGGYRYGSARKQAILAWEEARRGA
jgi:AraC family transcriptional regulator of adaptative response/methylated-DNA-[protein]-cysteine methyltransferase